ncbi:MAG: HlyD family efflux transporter periplasmic adaptor subunit [Magnetococcales bacterium]|nr:HlyD family efflux transporter periplasmic adaptor subunit [Magnetococcales bacterium]
MNFSPLLTGNRRFPLRHGLAWIGMVMCGWAMAADGPSNRQETPPSIAHTLTEIRAYLVPRTQTTLSSQIDAAIQTLPVKEGETFATGATLVTFDCATLTAQLNKARTVLQAAKEKNQVMQRLAQLHSVGTLEADASRGEQSQAEADIKFQETRLRGCRIQAPFAGKIANLLAREHQYVTPGHQLMKILDHRHLEMEMVVPSRWLTWLKTKERFTIHIDETGKSYPAAVIRVGAEADPVSQTIKIVGEALGENPELLPGMSGVAVFAPPADATTVSPKTHRAD